MSTSAGTFIPTEEDLINAILMQAEVEPATDADKFLDDAIALDPIAAAVTSVLSPPKPWYERYYGRLAKSVFYRIYSSTVTMFISYAVTRKWTLSVALGVLDFTVKIFTYWVFEMAWWKVVKQSPKLKKVFNT